MVKKFYHILISLTTMVCLSLVMSACGSKPAAPEIPEETESDHLLDSQFIFEEAVAKSSTPSLADDNSNYSEKVLPETGITLQLPEEYVNTDGIISYSDSELFDDSGIYFASASYIGMSEDEYNSMLDNQDLTDEAIDYAKSRIGNIFIILAIDENRGASALINALNKAHATEQPLTISCLTKLTEVDGCTFYEYSSENEATPVLEDVFETEFETLTSLKDELIRNATFTAPKIPFGDVIGTRLSFTTTDIDGNEITSDDIFSQNEVTMLNIWATWCSFCVEELPDLEAMNKEFSKQDCAIVGILGDDPLNAETLKLGKTILEENGVTYLNILRWDGWDDIKPSLWPTSFFVNRDGYIIGRPVEGAEPYLYESRIDSILSGEISLPSDSEQTPEISTGAYKIYVVDKRSNPISGVTVQFCSDSTCKMAVTGENGMVSFDDPEGLQYEVHILNVPDGYKKDSSLYLTETYYSDLEIVLEKD